MAVAERVLLTAYGRRIPLGNRRRRRFSCKITTFIYLHSKTAHRLTCVTCMAIMTRPPRFKTCELIKVPVFGEIRPVFLPQRNMHLFITSSRKQSYETVGEGSMLHLPYSRRRVASRSSRPTRSLYLRLALTSSHGTI